MAQAKVAHAIAGSKRESSAAISQRAASASRYSFDFVKSTDKSPLQGPTDHNCTGKVVLTMASIGPPLPAHLLKRKRSIDHDGPDPPTSSKSRSPSVDSARKRRVLGPATPPANLDERPASSPSASPEPTEDQEASSDSDSDFGPAPATTKKGAGSNGPVIDEDAPAPAAASLGPQKPQREEWMLAPPTHGDWTSRVDPTKLRNRKFNTGKGAKAPNQSTATDNRLWTETPEQKRQRLADEVLGAKKPAQVEAEATKKSARSEAEDRETERKIREYNEAHRGKSLAKEHKSKAAKEEEDDPSQRAFDREKDIGGGTISFTKRREMMSKAADFGSRFAKGSYL